MRRRRAVGWLVLSASVLLVSGCSSGRPSCNSAGVQSGVAVTFENGVLPRSGDVAITACVDQECRTHVAPANEPSVFVPVLPRPAGETVHVRVTVLNGKAKTLFDGTTTALVHEIQPGGAACGSWQVGVIALQHGRLTPTP